MRGHVLFAILLTTVLAAGAALAAGHAHKKHAAPAQSGAQGSTPGGAPSSTSASDLSLTVYNNDLVLVQDIRTVDVPKGRSRIEFPDVSASIRPETVSLTSKGLSVVEQNFDYDLLTPAKMMEKQVGKAVELVRTNPATGKETHEEATVLSVNSGVVLRIGPRIEALRDDGLPTRVVFRSIPENLRASPTLSVVVDAESAGPHKIDLSYLANGLSWSAAYVGMYDETRDAMGLQGWVTIKNSSGTSFKDANTELIAGSIESSGANQTYNGSNNARVEAGTGAKKQTAEEIADFYAYRMPGRVTVANQQTKQIAFLDIADARAQKAYLYVSYQFDSTPDPVHVPVYVDFANAGDAMPEGLIRVYMRDSKGEPKFVGESGVGHTPAGSDIWVQLGQAFDVTVQKTLVTSEALEEKSKRYKISYGVRNARDKEVTVGLRQEGIGDDGRVVDESQKSRRISASAIGWDVVVPAHGETTLTATVETKD